MKHMLGLWALFWIGGLKRRNKVGVENDEMAIVNSQLSVGGVEKVSAIDASVMSSIQSANINAAMIMLAESQRYPAWQGTFGASDTGYFRSLECGRLLVDINFSR
jgi:hypothetical protein